MPTDDESVRDERNLIEYAKTTTDDLYTLLGIPSPFRVPSNLTTGLQDSNGSPSTEIQARILKDARKTMRLRYHPDKNKGNEAEAAAKFFEVTRALAVLENPVAKDAYDKRQLVKLAQRQKEEALSGRRREMIESLKRAEAMSAAGTPIGLGMKRKWGENGATPEQQAKVERLAAEGARRVREKNENLRRQREGGLNAVSPTWSSQKSSNNLEDPFVSPRDETKPNSSSSTFDTDPANEHDKKTSPNASSQDLRPRTVKVQWLRSPDVISDPISADALTTLFSKFGKVEFVHMLKEKKSRPSISSNTPTSKWDSDSEHRSEKKKFKKKLMGRAIVDFASADDAFMAVLEANAQIQKPDGEWRLFDSVSILKEDGSTGTIDEVTSGQGTTASSGANVTAPGTLSYSTAMPSTTTSSNNIGSTGTPGEATSSYFQRTLERLKEAGQRQKAERERVTQEVSGSEAIEKS